MEKAGPLGGGGTSIKRVIFHGRGWFAMEVADPHSWGGSFMETNIQRTETSD